jgi:replicative DNA helicase
MSGEDLGRVPPNDLPAERAVLGGVMLDNGVIDEIGDLLAGKPFYSSANGIIWAHMLKLHGAGRGVDSVTLRGALVDSGKLAAVGGDEYLLGLGAEMPSVALVGDHAARVAEMATRRAIISAAHHTLTEAYGGGVPTDELADDAERRLLEATQHRAVVTGGPVRLGDALPAVEQRMRDGIGKGISLGLKRLHGRTNGARPGTLTIIAARPGMGKTAFALGSAIRVADRSEGPPSVFFSLEMPLEECVTRSVCHQAKINVGRGLRGELRPDEWTRYAGHKSRLERLPLFIDETPGITIGQLRSRCRRMHARHGGLSAIYIDYLQLMYAGSTDRRMGREQEISTCSRQLKELSKEIKVPVIALSQLNRKCEERPDKRPHIGDLRESGAIEQDADDIYFLYRDHVYNPATADEKDLEIIIRKQRGGKLGTVHARWLGEYCRVDDLDGSHDEPVRQKSFGDHNPGGSGADFRDW